MFRILIVVFLSAAVCAADKLSDLGKSLASLDFIDECVAAAILTINSRCEMNSETRSRLAINSANCWAEAAGIPSTCPSSGSIYACRETMPSSVREVYDIIKIPEFCSLLLERLKSYSEATIYKIKIGPVVLRTVKDMITVKKKTGRYVGTFVGTFGLLFGINHDEPRKAAYMIVNSFGAYTVLYHSGLFLIAWLIVRLRGIIFMSRFVVVIAISGLVDVFMFPIFAASGFSLAFAGYIRLTLFLCLVFMLFMVKKQRDNTSNDILTNPFRRSRQKLERGRLHEEHGPSYRRH